MKPVNPLSQEYFDENRSVYTADTTIADYKIDPCQHMLVRRGDDIFCTKCHAGWIGLGRVKGILTS